MSDVNAIINIDINSSSALVNLKRLESQIDQFNRSVAASNSTAAASQQSLNRALLDGINNTGLFNARVVPVESSMMRFSKSLDEGKMSLGEYTRAAASQLPGMSRVFKKEFSTIEQVATSRVKSMQTQYLALGKTIDGVTKAIASTPTGLAKGMATDLAMTQQRQQIFNKLLDDGSTKLLNWGKNTQWAGRQLMVGFSLPLAAFGAAASKTFMEIDKATVSLKRVYGDLSTTKAELDSNVEAVKGLGKEYTKYGITLAETIDLSARAAATGATNEQLMAATEQTLRFATLGQMDYNQALDTTISLQTAFAISNEDLGKTVDYLNAVENQTILTMEDMSLAIPRVATVVKGLGGSVEDLAVMMTAMREGGVSAENAANGLKSGLASLINPTKRASEGLAAMGVNLNSIITQNKGDLMGIVTEFGTAINKLDEFSRQQVLEQVFGKFQYARMSALFTNITKDAGQAARAMDIAGMSASDLAKISEKELGQISESTSVKFQAAMENLKISIAPIGEAFLKGITPIVNMVSKIAEAFNNLPDGVKNSIAVITGVVAGLGPVFLMTIGLLGNGLANLIKGFQFVRKTLASIKGDASAFTWLAQGELEAVTASKALEGTAVTLTDKLLLQKGAVSALTAEYQRFVGVAGIANAEMGVMGGTGGGGRSMPTPRVRKNMGGTIPGVGSTDTVPAMLTPGEFVINKKSTSQNLPLLHAINDGQAMGAFNKGGQIPGVQYFGIRPNIGGAVKARTEAPKGMRRQVLDRDFANGAGITEQQARDIIDEMINTGIIPKPSQSTYRQMTEIDTSHRFSRYSNGKKEWELTNLFSAPGLENRGFEYLFGKRRKVPRSIFAKMFESKKRSKSDEQLFNQIFGDSGKAPSTKEDADFMARYMQEFNDYVETSIDPSIAKFKKSKSYNNGWGRVLARAYKERSLAYSYKGGKEKPMLPKYPEMDEFGNFKNKGGQILGGKVAKGKSFYGVVTPRSRQLFEALTAWQTSSRAVRENPEMLSTLMSSMSPLTSRRTLTRGTTLGLNRGSEFNTADESAIMDALQSGNIDSIIGREFDMRGPISYTAGGTENAVNAMRQNADVNRIKFLKAQQSEAQKRHESNLNRIKTLKEKIAKGTGPVDLYKSQLKELEGFVSMYPAGQAAMESEIRGLASKGHQELIIQQDFIPGSPIINVDRANPNGTFMGKKLEESEFLSGGSRVRIKGVGVDEKTGVRKLELETIPSDVIIEAPVNARKGNYRGTVGKSDQEIRADIEQRKALISIMDPERLLAEALKPEVGGYELSRIVQAVMEKATDPKQRRTILKAIANSRGQEIGTNAWGGYNQEFGYATRGASESATWRQVWNALKSEGTYIPWKKTTGPQAQSRNDGGPIFESQTKIVPGIGNTDTVPAMLTPGEFVINKQSTKENLPLLHAINNGQVLNRNTGGIIPQYFGTAMPQRVVQSARSAWKAKSGAMRSAGPAGTSRNMVAADYNHMFDLDRATYEKYMRSAFEDKLIATGQQAELESVIAKNSAKMFDKDGKFISSLVSSDQSTRRNAYLKSGYSSMRGIDNLTATSMLQLKEISQARRLESVFNELKKVNSPHVKDLDLKSFYNKVVTEGSNSAATVGSSINTNYEKLNKDFIQSVNEIYVRQAYGLSPEQSLRMYRTETGLSGKSLGMYESGRKTASQLAAGQGTDTLGYYTIDPNLALSFKGAVGKGASVMRTDLPVKDLPQILNSSGYADELAMAFPKDKLLKSHIDTSLSSAQSKSRAFALESTYVPSRIKEQQILNVKDDLIKFIEDNNIANSPTRRLFKSYVRGGKKEFTVDLGYMQHKATPEEIQFLRMLQDKHGIELVRQKTSTGLKPAKFNTGNQVPGVGNTDKVPAMLTPGEFVINKEATQSNLGLLHAINDGNTPQSMQGFNKGGQIPGVQYFVRGGGVSIPDSLKKLKNMGARPEYIRQFELQMIEAERARAAAATAGYSGETKSNISRGHVLSSGSTKTFSMLGRERTSRFNWMPQASIENQMSQTLKSSPQARESVKSYIQGKPEGTFGESKKIEKILTKMEKGTMLSYKESLIQRKIFKSMLASQVQLPAQLPKAFLEASISATTAREEFRKTGGERERLSTNENERRKIARESSMGNITRRSGVPTPVSTPIPDETQTRRNTNIPKAEKEMNKKLKKQILKEVKAQILQEEKSKPEYLKRVANEQVQQRFGQGVKPPLGFSAEELAQKSANERITKEAQARASKIYKERVAAAEPERYSRSRELAYKTNELIDKKAARILKERGALPPSQVDAAKVEAMNRAKQEVLGNRPIAESPTLTKKTGFLSRVGGKVGMAAGGLGGGLMMASMAPMMMADKETGKFMGMDPNAAMMGMMGAGTAVSMLPMLGAAAGPVAAVGVVAAGLGVALKMWRDTVDGAATQTAKLGANMGGAANAMGNMADILGVMDPAKARNFTQLGVKPKEVEEFAKYSEMLKGESGAKFIKEMQSLTSDEKFQKLSDYLKNAIASGMLDKGQAQLFAKAVGASLNDQILSLRAGAAISGQVKGTKGVLDIAQQRERIVLENKGIANVLKAKSGQELDTMDASLTIGAGMQVMKAFSEAIAQAEKEYRDGTIKFKEFNDTVTLANTSINKWSDAVKIAREQSSNDSLGGIFGEGSTGQAAQIAMDLAGVSEEQRKGIEDSYNKMYEMSATNKAGSVEQGLFQYIGQVVTGKGQEQRYETKDNQQYTIANEGAFKKLEAQAQKAGFGGNVQGVEKWAKEADPEIVRKAFADANAYAKDLDLAVKDDALKTTMQNLVALGQDASSVAAQANAIYNDPVALKAFNEAGRTVEAFATALEVANSTMLFSTDEFRQKFQSISAEFFSPEYKNAFNAYVSSAATEKGRETRVSEIQNIGSAFAGTSGEKQAKMDFLDINTTASQYFNPETIQSLLNTAKTQGLFSKTQTQQVTSGKRDAEGRVISQDVYSSYSNLKSKQFQKTIDEAGKAGLSDQLVKYSIDISTKDGKDPNDVLKEITQNFTNLQSVPQEILLALNIDVNNGEDVSKFGTDVEDLSRGWGMLNALNPNIDVSMVASAVLLDGNGEVIKDPVKIAKSIMEINKAYAQLEKASGKKAKVSAQIRLAQAFIDDKGNKEVKGEDVVKNANKVLKGIAKSINDLPAAKASMVLQIQSDLEIANAERNAKIFEYTIKQNNALARGQVGEASGYANMVSALLKEGRAQKSQADADILTIGAGDTGAGSSGGGGGAKENPLLDLKKSMLEQIKMYVDINATMKKLNDQKYKFADLISGKGGVIGKLRGLKGKAGGLSDSVIDVISSLGPDAAKKWIAKNTKGGKLTKEGQSQAELISAGKIRGTIEGNLAEFRGARAQRRAYRNLRGRGLDNSVVQAIAGDPEKAKQLEELQARVNAGIKGSVKDMNTFINSQIKATKQAELLARAQDPLQTKIDDLTMAHRIDSVEIDKQVKIYEDQITEINKQITAIQELNNGDQNRIRDLDRQKEMISRQIETLNRANELDQRRADSLKREDEIRNRTADALSHDLDIMSKKESEIQSAYDKRIKALDEVAKINDYIISQQRSQLGLAQALSQGDVYAAAAAQQEMQVGSAQFAQTQMRTGLQTGMENQIAGLTTTGGLTRDQAEAQIAAIKEQSYQTSLQIRDIEDAIYNRNLQIIPLKDSQLVLDGQIQVIQDAIYIRETEIIKIQDSKLKPIQAQLEKELEIKKTLDDKFNSQVADYELQKDIVNMIDAQSTAVATLSEQYAGIAAQIKNINNLAAGAKEDIVKPVAKPKQTKKEFDEKWKEYNDKISAIEAKRVSDAAAVVASMTPVNKAVGGIIGNGGRDSIPAMLTPGEFVMRKASVQKYGMPMLSSMNMGAFDMPRYNMQDNPTNTPTVVTSNNTTVSAPVYNSYSVNVNSTTNASADEIANTVMTKIKRVDSMAVRNFRGY